MSGLKPPRITTELSSSESDTDHFSSASEGTPPRLSISQSPIPQTRVERVDDEPAYGEIPGTPAYNMREQDAVPDEIKIVPEAQRSRSNTTSRSRASSAVDSSRPATPGGTKIPRTVVERVDDKPAYGEVEGTLAKELRSADAAPDEVRKVPEEVWAGKVLSPEGRRPIETEERQAWFRSMWEGGNDRPDPLRDEIPKQDADADAAGDDFDEFEEDGGEEFGEFDDADATPMPQDVHRDIVQPAPPDLLIGLPPLNLSNLSHHEIEEALRPYLDAMFPDDLVSSSTDDLPPLNPAASPFLSDRSLSLWQQLVSPPPMQPPNWTRSRIRRLFLVSLGVPVDLDEILPPSKQKRLILPNINLPSASPRPSTTLDRLKDMSGTANSSTTSLDSKTGAPKGGAKARSQPSAKKGPPLPPDFDSNAAALLCGTTEQALWGLPDEELSEYVARLENWNRRASAVLEYWLQRKDESLKEKEALEGVIENLVGFVKGRRGR